MALIESKDIIVEFLRARITDPRGRHTSGTQTFSGDGSTTEFSFVTSGNTKVQAITAVTVGGSSKKKWDDYKVDIKNQKIIFNTAPASGSNNISVTTLEGTSSWIYPDLPRIDLSPSSYPRIGITTVAAPGVRLGRYDADVETFLHVRADVFVKENYTATISSQVFEGVRMALYLAQQIAAAFRQYEDDIYPVMYDYSQIDGPREDSFDVDRQSFRASIELGIKQLNIGEGV